MKRTTYATFKFSVLLSVGTLIFGSQSASASVQRIIYGNNAGFSPDIVNKVDLDSGLNLQSYTPSSGNGRGVVVVGNVLYSTAVNDPHIYKTDATTGASLGSILTDQVSLSTLAWDGTHF